MNNTEEDDCQKEGVVFLYREFPDAPEGYKEEKTKSWQECRQKCAKIEACKGFTWHNGNNFYAFACSLFSAHNGQMGISTTVSGLKGCPTSANGTYL